MAKKSGFAVRITAFIEADAKNIESMNGAMQSISLIGEAFTTHGFRDLKVESRFMLSKDIPDEPKAAQAVVTGVQVQAGKPPVAHLSDGTTRELEDFPPIPPAQRRA